MKRAIFALAVLALAAVGGAAAYQAVAQRNYSALLTPRRHRAARRPDLQRDRGLQRRHRPAARLDARLPAPRPDLPAPWRPRRSRGGRARFPHRRAASTRPPPARSKRSATCCSSSQQYARAVAAYERCVRLDDRSARVSYKLGAGALSRPRHRRRHRRAATTRCGSTTGWPTPTTCSASACASSTGLPRGAEGARDKRSRWRPAWCRRARSSPISTARSIATAEELEQLQVIAGLDRDHVARQVAIGLAHARAGHWDLAVLTLGRRARAQPERAGDLPRARQGLARTAARRSRLPRARRARRSSGSRRARRRPARC